MISIRMKEETGETLVLELRAAEILYIYIYIKYNFKKDKQKKAASILNLPCEKTAL